MYVEIRRTSIYVYPYLLGDSRELEKSLSLWDVVENKYTMKLYYYESETKTLKIPRGYGHEQVIHKLKSSLIEIDDVIDRSELYAEPRLISFKINPLYRIKDENDENFGIRDKYQKESVNFLVHNKNAQKMLSLDVGFGKTFCTIMAARELGCVTLIICRTLGQQWIKFILDDHKGYTNLNKNEVYYISGTKSIEKLLKKRNPKEVFYVASTDTLRQYLKNGGDLQELMAHLGVGIKVFDEAHLNYLANTIIDCNTDIKYTFYLTATPGRSETRQDYLFKLIYRFVPIFGTETHSLKKYYNIRYVKYNTFPTANDVAECTTKHGFNSRLYSEYIFTDFNRRIFYYGMMRYLITKVLEQDPEARILIILDKKRDIQEFYDMLKKDLNINSGRYCTLIEKASLREKELENNVIFSTIGSGVVGKDIPNLRVILAMTSFSSNIITRQLLGRLRYIVGKKVYYFDFTDIGFKQMIDQARVRNRELLIRANSTDIIEFDFKSTIEYVINEFPEIALFPIAMKKKKNWKRYFAKKKGIKKYKSKR